jgi:hypothetical protein
MKPLVILVGVLLLIVCVSLIIRQAFPGCVHSTCTAENYEELKECKGAVGTFQYNKTVDQVTGYISGLVVGVVGTVVVVAGTHTVPSRKPKQKPRGIRKPTRIVYDNAKHTDDGFFVEPDNDYDDGDSADVRRAERDRRARLADDHGMNDMIFKNGKNVYKKQPIESNADA